MKSSAILNANGKPFEKANGHARHELIEYFAKSRTERKAQRAEMAYDAASDSDEYSKYWANADTLDADSANSTEKRRTLRSRSRYESESNGVYDGNLKTHCDMVVGVGPKLRMLTEDRNYNQLVEKDWSAWCEKVQLRRKLWSIYHAKVQDGEGMAILQTNPAFPEDDVQLDITPIEADQCSTPFPVIFQKDYFDGIRKDSLGNILWYDILPMHPGASWQFGNLNPIRVEPSQVIHWFTLKRPGTQRQVPDLTSTLNCGAAFRRWREATIAKAETQAEFTAFLESLFQPDELDPVVPMSTLNIEKRMLAALPNNQRIHQLENNTPGAQFNEFYRSLISEQASPLAMPYNVAAHDSSTYSFASGKLDTLCYRAAVDVERCDGDLLVLDKIFVLWYREWILLDRRRSITDAPIHQWDWPAHPVIDDEADSRAKETRLKTGQTSLRQIYSEAGSDYEDQLVVMAQDWFGNSDEESIKKARTINFLRNIPADVLPYAAAMTGLPPVKTGAANAQ